MKSDNYMQKHIGKYVRVDMGNDYEYGVLKSYSEDDLTIECLDHIRSHYKCEEKIISRRIVTTITTFTEEKKKEHIEEFKDMIEEIESGEGSCDECKGDNNRIEVG